MPSSQKDDTRQSGKEIFRLFQLDALFQEDRYYSVQDLTERLEVSVATLNRDLRRLRDNYRAPLEFSREHDGYHYTSHVYKLASVFVPEEEMPAYALVLKLFEMFQDTPLYRPLLNICETFESPVKTEVVDVNQTNFKSSHLPQKPWFETRIVMAKRQVDAVDEAVWTTILQALQSNTVLQFDYESVSTNQTSYGRTLEPWQMVFDREQWYLIGRTKSRDEPSQKVTRTFIVPRMKQLTLTREHFTLPDEKVWQVDKYAVGAFGALAGFDADCAEEAENYQFIFQGAALYFAKATFSAEQTVEPYTGTVPHKEGALLVTFKSNQAHAIIRDFFSYGADIIPLAPAHFVADWKNRVREMAEYLKDFS